MRKTRSSLIEKCTLVNVCAHMTMYIDGRDPDFTYQKCKRKIIGRVICEFAKFPNIHIKGLCEESKIDRSFQLIDPSAGERKNFSVFTFRTVHCFPLFSGDERRKWAGPTGWVLAYYSQETVWKITNIMNPNNTFTLTSQDNLPVGRRPWFLSKSSCNQGLNEERVLLLSTCTPGLQFTCDNGECIDIVNRCDGLVQCNDQSVEKACILAYTDPDNYLKGKVTFCNKNSSRKFLYHFKKVMKK